MAFCPDDCPGAAGLGTSGPVDHFRLGSTVAVATGVEEGDSAHSWGSFTAVFSVLHGHHFASVPKPYSQTVTCATEPVWVTPLIGAAIIGAVKWFGTGSGEEQEKICGLIRYLWPTFGNLSMISRDLLTYFRDLSMLFLHLSPRYWPGRLTYR